MCPIYTKESLKPHDDESKSTHSTQLATHDSEATVGGSLQLVVFDGKSHRRIVLMVALLLV